MDITVTEVRLGFENVEGVHIPPQYVTDVRIAGIKEWRIISRRGDDELGVFLRAKDAEKFIMVIDKAAKGQVLTFEGNELFERITRHADITDIELKYSDGLEENIYVDWEDGNAGGEINALQRHYFDNEGNLVIKIGKLEVE